MCQAQDFPSNQTTYIKNCPFILIVPLTLNILYFNMLSATKFLYIYIALYPSNYITSCYTAVLDIFFVPLLSQQTQSFTLTK